MACFRKPSDENLEIRRLTRLKTYKQPIKQVSFKTFFYYINQPHSHFTIL